MTNDNTVSKAAEHFKYEMQRISSLLNSGSINTAAEAIKILASDMNRWVNEDGTIICFGREYIIEPKF